MSNTKSLFKYYDLLIILNILATNENLKRDHYKAFLNLLIDTRVARRNKLFAIQVGFLCFEGSETPSIIPAEAIRVKEKHPLIRESDLCPYVDDLIPKETLPTENNVCELNKISTVLAKIQNYTDITPHFEATYYEKTREFNIHNEDFLKDCVRQGKPFVIVFYVTNTTADRAHAVVVYNHDYFDPAGSCQPFSGFLKRLKGYWRRNFPDHRLNVKNPYYGPQSLKEILRYPNEYGGYCVAWSILYIHLRYLGYGHVETIVHLCSNVTNVDIRRYVSFVENCI